LIIVDGNNLAWRNVWVLKEQGFSAILNSFLRTLILLEQRHDDIDLCLVWDTGCYKRRELYPGYKVSKEEMPEKEKVIKFIDSLRKVMEFVSPPCYYSEWEADDTIATLVRRNSSEPIVVVSSDEDLLGLISRTCKIDRHPGIRDFDWFWHEHMFDPKLWVWVKTSVGCSSDAVPGIKYLNRKRLYSVIADMSRSELQGLLDSVTKNEPTWRLKFDQDILRRNYELVRLRDNVELQQVNQVDFGELRNHLEECGGVGSDTMGLIARFLERRR